MARTDKELLERLLATFAEEADEHVRALSAGLLELEQAPAAARRQELVERVFREVHSLKGAARAVALDNVQTLCHAMESVFAALKRGTIASSPALLDLLHHANAALRMLVPAGGAALAGAGGAELPALVSALEAAAAGAAAPAAATRAAEAEAEDKEHGGSGAAARETSAATIRVATAKLDALLRQAEELISAKLTAEQRARETRELAEALAEHVKTRAASRRLPAAAGGSAGKRSDVPRAARAASELERLSHLLAQHERTLNSFAATAAALTAAVERDQRAFAKLADTLLEDAKQALMVPVSALFEPLGGLVRELARAEGKEVDLVIRGDDIEIDRRIQEEMKGALLHLVRNSIDHGIERPAERASRGKPPRGIVTIAVSQREAGKAEVAVSDDGNGIDLEKVRAAAAKSGTLTPREAAAMDGGKTMQLIFRSGLSTSAILTDVSGRGLGLAIVKEKVEGLGGTMTLASEPGRGATFRLVLPVTRSSFRGIVVKAGAGTFILPSSHVERVARVKPGDIKTVENRDSLEIAGETLSLVRLGDALELADRETADAAQDHRTVVVLAAAEKRIAFMVDAVLNEQEVLVKGLGRQLSRVRNVAGATMLGSGALVPVLNVRDLLASAAAVAARARPEAPSAGPARQRAILVAEDSLTARALLKNILEAAGFRVRTAVDGIDAWTALKSEAFDLVVSDVEMPRMDGFGLTARIREDKKLAELPVVLVTALESREDRERGIDAGADAYIVKSSFDQSNLLETIERLV